ncbi:TrbI/VirB10 family protein [Phenylobacterium immobile]|uniref:TrbI/VirB10 family protein n=1 Tax=Phenylobacterium immobile TaxID=21 RepID=UPI000A579107|nr:TrbI/VirB10 family protein [Phenylobacterium immobile]
MRETLRYERLPVLVQRDPRDAEGAEIISLATRNTLPAVSQRKGRSEAMTLVAGVAVVALLGAVTFTSMSEGQRQAVPAAAPNGQLQVSPNTAPTEAPYALPAEAFTPLPLQAPAPQAVLGVSPNTQMTLSNPLSTPTVVFDASALPAGVPVGAAGAAGASPATGGPNEEFANRIGGIGGGSAVATAGINPQTTVTQGTLIPAVLETAIDTDIPGYVRAVVSSDVRGFDGTRIMIPRSSRLIGQYKSGMQAGQKRAYVVWSRLIRPDGVSVNIASPATSFGGETGLAGQVNNHFFERFGSAMLLSVVGGLSAIGGNGASVIIGGQTQSAAAAAVGQSGQIGPTIRVRQGEPIRVFTARDLDFSKVATQ